MTRNQHWRGALFCVAIYLGCLAIAWPFAEMAFVDDWSYIKTAQIFAQTGKLRYVGWSYPILGWQTAWGALFIKLFGFSYTAVKLSTVPIAVFTIFLFYAILARYRIKQTNAIAGTLLFCVSPLFLPLSVSFMTDVYGVFSILLCTYCCKRALDADSGHGAALWIICAAAGNLISGTVRQSAWLGVLVMVPVTGWLLRSRRNLFRLSLILWLAGCVAVIGIQHWFSNEDYVFRIPFFPMAKHGVIAEITYPLMTGYRLWNGYMFIALLVFPLLVAWLPLIRKHLNRAMIYAFAGVLLMLLVQALFGPFGTMWPPHVVNSELSVRRGLQIGWENDWQQSLLPLPVQAVIMFVVMTVSYGLVSLLVEKIRPGKGKLPLWIFSSRGWLIGAYFLAYSALLIPYAWVANAFDRYLLGLIPFVILAILWLYQRFGNSRLPRWSALLLLCYATFSVAGTHDWFAWQRARLAAIAEVLRAGVSRTEIYGGWEYDAWTQMDQWGYVNDARVVNPPGAYKPQPPVPPNDPCAYDFAPFVPAIHAKYTLLFVPGSCADPAPFAPVPYTSWIPPFRRTIYVQRIPESRRNSPNSANFTSHPSR